jgi:alpha-beta hydrolase superfamily lysophospholipase
MRRPVHGYLTGPRPVFGTYHPPTTPAQNLAYVICPPLGWESIQCYHSLRQLGEGLAASGFHVIRLAYDGTGESAGDDESPSRVRAWLDSIHQAADTLAAVQGVTGVGLVGVRIGATLAAQVATERPVAALVLWEACPSGAHYVREMEILASAAPGAKAQLLVAETTGGIDAGGYVLSRETLADLSALDVWKATPQGAPPVLLLGRSDRPAPTRIAERLTALGCTVRTEQPVGYKEMMIYPEASVPATAGFECIRAWALEQSVAVPPAEARGSPRLSQTLDLGEITRTIVRFGHERRLMGVRTAPARPQGRSDPPVLFLTGGVVPRTAVNRMYVTLADGLAALGHDTLRFDVSGIGESVPGPGAAWGNPYSATLLDEARTALRTLRADVSDEPAWLVGLCSGAYAAFRLAMEDPSVAGIVLLNPAAFRVAEGGTSAPEEHLGSDAKHYRKAVLDPARWRRLLSGRANVRRSLGNVVGRARMRRAARATRAAQRSSGAVTLADDFVGLVERGTRVHILFADGDPGVEALREGVDGKVDRLIEAGVAIHTFEGADHTFNSSRIRATVVERIIDTISSR